MAKGTALQGATLKRTLAVEIRASSLGYVVVERVSTLLDWGVRRRFNPRHDAAFFFARIVHLLDAYEPADIVVREIRRSSPTTRAPSARCLRMIRRAAKERSIAVRIVKRRSIRTFFRTYGCRSKHARSVVLAEWFGEMRRYVQPLRKNYQNEKYGMRIFDALGAAMTFFGGE